MQKEMYEKPRALEIVFDGGGTGKDAGGTEVQ